MANVKGEGELGEILSDMITNANIPSNEVTSFVTYAM